MADTKITGLTAASALAGTEVFPVVQSSTTKKATIDQVSTRLATSLAGTFQALHANLTALAGLTGAANKIAYFTGVGAQALADFTALARTLAATATAQAFCAALGIWWPVASSAVQVSTTGDTNEHTFATVTIPAGAMGANGRVRITTLWSNNNDASTKTAKVFFGATQYLAGGLTTNVNLRNQTEICNRNATNSQIGNSGQQGAGGWGGTTTSLPTSAIDTTAAVDVVIAGQLADGTDSIALEAYLVEVLYKA